MHPVPGNEMTDGSGPVPAGFPVKMAIAKLWESAQDRRMPTSSPRRSSVGHSRARKPPLGRVGASGKDTPEEIRKRICPRREYVDFLLLKGAILADRSRTGSAGWQCYRRCRR